MIPRSSLKRKYCPAFEALERKQLLSTGLPTYGPAVEHATAPLSSQVGQVHVTPDGTGKSIIIVTS